MKNPPTKTKKEREKIRQMAIEFARQYSADIENDICPIHKTPMTMKQKDYSIYADPCGCRLGVGEVDDEITDHDLITDKLYNVGGIFKGSTEVLTATKPFELDFWKVGEKDLIVWSNDEGQCGLYSFVGNQGDPVEKDLEFIDSLFSESNGK